MENQKLIKETEENSVDFINLHYFFNSEFCITAIHIDKFIEILNSNNLSYSPFNLNQDLEIDIATKFYDPFTTYKTMSFICDYKGSYRQNIKKKSSNNHYEAFLLFKSDYQIAEGMIDLYYDIRSEIAYNAKKIGIRFLEHSNDGIYITNENLLSIADDLQKLIYLTKNIVKSYKIIIDKIAVKIYIPQSNRLILDIDNYLENKDIYKDISNII